MYEDYYNYDFSDCEIYADKDEGIISFENVYIDIDTRKLTTAQETELLEKLENIGWRAENDDYAGEVWADVDFYEVVEDDDAELYGRLVFEGYVPETIYKEVLELLIREGYDVTFKEG